VIMKPRMAEKIRRKRERFSTFVCSDCGSVFSTQAELNAHLDCEDYGIGCDDEFAPDSYGEDVPLALRTERAERAKRLGKQRGLDEFG
jgi:hypothetical protein